MTGHRREPPAISFVHAQARQVPSQGPRTNSWSLDIGGEWRSAPDSRGVGVALLVSCLASTARAAAQAPPAPGLPVRNFIVGRWGSRSEEYHVILMP